ncbi:MAG: glycosyltransferase [Candidatus Electrothrix sp. AR4]|nr:glycosyltransferase [Candidatus Electrothrix sp. AR4]
MTPKLTFFIARHSNSGVPLAQIRLAKSLSRRGYPVEFVIGYVPNDVAVPEIKGVKVINLDVPRTFKLILPVFFYIKKNMPDVIFSAEDHLNAVVTLAVIFTGSKAKLSTSSRVTPYDTYSNTIFSKRWVLKQINKVLWYRVDALVCVSKDMVKQYEDIFGATKYQCLYNVVCDSELYRKMVVSVDDPWLNDRSIPLVITAGRLAPEKCFPDLIIAMKILLRAKEVRLVILGDGPLRADLDTLIKEEGLDETVRLLGFQNNPYKYFSKARVFVLSSCVEGLPNVLVEAMACGCTPVSTDCPTGPREVLKNGRYGYLVPMHDPVKMAIAIKMAIEQPVPLKGLKDAIQPFTEELVIKRHKEILGF